MNSNYDHQKPSQSADPQTIQLEDDGKSRKICFVAQNHYHIGMSLLTD